MVFAPTELLSPGLKRLLDVRRVVGLRNPGHSVVKLMQPCEGDCVVVGSYTHPAYAESMAATFELMGTTALLSRGTRRRERGRPAPHRRRSTASSRGRRIALQAQQPGTLTEVPGLPADIDVADHRRLHAPRAGRRRRRCRTPSRSRCAHVLQLTPTHMEQRMSLLSHHGSCTLVGAGPGDPELLTIKAVKAIQAATVLLVDDLVSDEILRPTRGPAPASSTWASAAAARARRRPSSSG